MLIGDQVRLIIPIGRVPLASEMIAIEERHIHHLAAWAAGCGVIEVPIHLARQIHAGQPGTEVCVCQLG